jgi:hypothetical protein
VTAPFPLVVLLNGPPYSGKDTASKAIRATPVFFASEVRISEALKLATHALYGLPQDTPRDAFDHCKDVPSELFGGLTPRAAYILVSEDVIKPSLGKDWLGKVALQKIRRAAAGGAHVIPVPDSGFLSEVGLIVEGLGHDSVMLVNIHSPLRGCSFAGDSRGYITVPGVYTVQLYNDERDNPAPYESAVRRAVALRLEMLIVDRQIIPETPPCPTA